MHTYESNTMSDWITSNICENESCDIPSETPCHNVTLFLIGWQVVLQLAPGASFIYIYLNIYDVYCIGRHQYQRYLNILFWGCLSGAVGSVDVWCSARQCC